MKINKKQYYILFWFIFLVCIILIILYFFIKNKDNSIDLKNEINDTLKRSSDIEKNKLLQKQNNINNFLDSLDLKTDSSLTKFVSAKVPFNDKSYIPKNLVNISWQYIIDWKWWGQQLREIAQVALNNMWKQYFRDTWKKIVVVSAYRSYLYQKWIKDRWCPDNLCAKAGYSEHQSWLAVDLWSASSKEFWYKNQKYINIYKWLKENAYKYWFTNSYQKWIDIDTYDIEPWHWRYVWKKLAKYLLDKNITFAEFYNKRIWQKEMSSN